MRLEIQALVMDPPLLHSPASATPSSGISASPPPTAGHSYSLVPCLRTDPVITAVEPALGCPNGRHPTRENLLMPCIRLLCRDRLNVHAVKHPVQDGGTWDVSPRDAASLVGGMIYLHQAKAPLHRHG